MTVEEFCEIHNACNEGREWAKGKTLSECWETAPAAWLIWAATRPGVLTDRELRLFACWCVRQVWHLLTDDRSRHAVEVAEKYAIGTASKEELSAAWSAARSAAESAAWSDTRSADEYAARSAAYAAESAARSVASASAMSSARSSAWSADESAAESDTWFAAESAQAAYLRTKVRLEMLLSSDE